MAEESKLEFRLRKINEASNYLLGEIKKTLWFNEWTV